MWASELQRETLGHSCKPQMNNYKMAECSAGPAPKMKKKYLVNFNTKWSDKHSFIKQSRKGDRFAFCEFCRYDFTLAIVGKMTGSIAMQQKDKIN